MLTALQDPYLPNPFAPDTQECEPTQADMEYGVIAIDVAQDNGPDMLTVGRVAFRQYDTLGNSGPIYDGQLGTYEGVRIILHPDVARDMKLSLGALPPGAVVQGTLPDFPKPDMVPRVQYEALLAEYDSEAKHLRNTVFDLNHQNLCLAKETERLRKEISSLHATVAACKQNDARQFLQQPMVAPGVISGNVGGLLSNTSVQRENDAIYRLCDEFPDIKTVDFASVDYDSSLRCSVVTSDGRRHFHDESLSFKGDILRRCEGGMRTFLLKQGYGGRADPRDMVAGDMMQNGVIHKLGIVKAGEVISLELVDKMIAQTQAMALTPRPPGQPPKHDTKLECRPISGSDPIVPPTSFGEYLSEARKAQFKF